MPGLLEHIERIDQHKAREQSFCAGEKHAAAKLRESVMSAIGSHNVMGRLRAAVIAHNGMGREFPGEKICDGALARVTKPEIGYKDGLFFLAHNVASFG